MREAGPTLSMRGAKTEHDALLLETESTPSMREGLGSDFHHSSTDAHHLVTLLTLWIICRLETLAQAKEVADAWTKDVETCRLDLQARASPVLVLCVEEEQSVTRVLSVADQEAQTCSAVRRSAPCFGATLLGG